MVRKGASRRPRTKAMLLPLPFEVVRTLSLENHLTLATMCSGHGTADTLAVLLRILYMTFYMLDQACTDADLALFLAVESMLGDGIHATAQGRDWRLPVENLPVFERMLLRYDDVVGSVARYHYQEAWNKLNRFARSPAQSSLPGSQLKDLWL